jgi:hypothetical protein
MDRVVAQAPARCGPEAVAEQLRGAPLRFGLHVTEPLRRGSDQTPCRLAHAPAGRVSLLIHPRRTARSLIKGVAACLGDTLRVRLEPSSTA